MVNYIYENFGYANIVLWVFALAVVIFVFAVMCAMIYVMTVQKIVLKTNLSNMANDIWLYSFGPYKKTKL